MNLGIFKVNYLGDNVVFLPVVQALRRRFPEWNLTLIADPRTAPLYAADIAAERLLTATPDAIRRTWRQPLELGRWWRRLRDRQLDASLVDHDQSSTAHALAWLAGGSPRVGAGGLRIRLRGTLTHEVPRREGWSIAQWSWEIARALVHALGERDWAATPPPPDLSHLAGKAAPERRRVVIHAGSKWTYTRWPLDRYAALAGRLARDHEVVWINVPETRGAPLPAGVRTREGTDLPALVTLLAEAALFVGNNSGPMHVANALGTPLVAVTGPSDRTWDPAWHRERVTVLRIPELACQPCEKVHFPPVRCANEAEPHACLHRWTVDAVEQACRERLARPDTA